MDFLFLDDVRGSEANGSARCGEAEVRFSLEGTDDGRITRLDLA